VGFLFVHFIFGFRERKSLEDSRKPPGIQGCGLGGAVFGLIIIRAKKRQQSGSSGLLPM